MKLTGMAIQKYRSIKRTSRLNLGDLTVLVGPNNEGKSNILRALVISMRLLRRYGLMQSQRNPENAKLRILNEYDWVDDYPKDLQARSVAGNTIIDLWFELDEGERERFRRLTGSRLKTELPIRLTIGKTVEFTVRKQGPGREALTSQSGKIAQFVGRALRIEYVESVRTASRAAAVVRDMVSYELEELSERPEITAVMKTLSSALKPVANRLSKELVATLRDFLPDVNNVQIEFETENILAVLSERARIMVNDGVSTELMHKGDGVQSLAALALVRKVAAQRRAALFLAVEEPEAHLHPRAIHQLRGVLGDIASKQQVAYTTHSPLLVDRYNLASNIIVRSNRAAPAKSIVELRDALGVRISDNLSNAALVLLVEGGCDAAAIEALLLESSKELSGALAAGALAVESLGSASNLSARLDFLRSQLCLYHVLLDNDDAGKLAAGKARSDGLLRPNEENFVIVPGQSESEFEDALDPVIYEQGIIDQFGVRTSAKEFRSAKGKWSHRLEATFRAQGKNWDDKVKLKAKQLVAEKLKQAPAVALHPQRSSSIESLIRELERRLASEGRL
ncbi:ATP-binding protein [Micromonospora sp. NPDC047074]|uniref:ATP-dependent nuclease n=1 Tax=Micromonospora sp. NPDC047074 TaxID=3154339 RepID=UPI00340AED46